MLFIQQKAFILCSSYSLIRVPKVVYQTLPTSSFENKIIHFFNELPKMLKKITLKYVLLFQHPLNMRESSTLWRGVTTFLCRTVFSLLQVSSTSPSFTTTLTCANIHVQPVSPPASKANNLHNPCGVASVPYGCYAIMSS